MSANNKESPNDQAKEYSSKALEDEVGTIKDEELLPLPSFWDKIPKFKWWVTPLNLLMICLFLILIDLATPPNKAFLWIDWAWWPVGGIFFIYAVSFIVFKRPAIAWIIGPLLMIGVSGLLLAIDLIYPPNDGFLSMDWAHIPIAALLTFGVAIPIITKLGRKKDKPIEKFRKAVAEIKRRESKQG